ncbi:MAG: DUF3048 domain-containing protein [Butyrivibrio sp.]|nr:DUF3048 domain-containing protein [Acetatifactor muris]MCM1559197.1 DUF3048 domain-containing protein [Butyrivibrio sp.]
MKKRKFVLMLIMISIFMLCSCGPKNDAPDSELPDSGNSAGFGDTVPPDSSLPADSAELSGEDDSLPPKEGMVHSRLTNEWVDISVADTRPIAVMTPNEHNAQPQYGISKASVIYEANVEGRMTRLLAIYEDWTDFEKIGNIRSLRTYYAYWAFEWDAFIIHIGHPYYVDELIAAPDTQTINESNYPDSTAFYRDESRVPPHNAFATGEKILDAVNRKGYSTDYRGLADSSHFRFTGASKQNTLEQYGEDAKSAVYIDMSGCYPVTRCYFDYNPEDGLYYRSQFLSGGADGPHIDGLTGEQLTFKNILVQNTKAWDLGDGYLAYQCVDNTEDGWYFTNGRGIHVTWEKSSDYGSTRYYDDSGNEILLNTGKTMICIVQSGDNFTFR